MFYKCMIYLEIIWGHNSFFVSVYLITGNRFELSVFFCGTALRASKYEEKNIEQKLNKIEICSDWLELAFRSQEILSV